MEEIVNVSNWYKDLSCDDTITLLDEKITNMRLDFIAAGFYMKRVRDEGYFKTLGYETMWDFAEDRYGIQKSTASRWMAMNDKYSKEGNSPILQEEYKVFNKSQLQEMLYLTDTQLQEVTPDMTVKEIREVRKPEQKEEKPKYNKPDDTQREYLNSAAKHLIICHKDWFKEDYLSRVLDVSKSQKEIKNKLGYKTWHFATDRGTASCSPFPEHVQLWNENGKYIGDFEWFYLSAAIQSMWNVVALEEVIAKQQTNTVATSQQDTSAEENSCPPNQSSCTRQNWGSSKEDQEAGRKECKKCWDHYKKLHKTVETTEQIQAEQNQIEREETEFVEEQLTDTDEAIIEGEYKEIKDERYEETTEDSDIKLLKKMLDNENHMLKMLSEEFTDSDIRVRKSKLKVGALASMLSDLEEIEVSKVEVITEQPEMPILKNNDQRKTFLENYQTWPIWLEVPEASETYHRFDLPDGSSIVICEYLYYAEWRKKYNNESPDTSATREYLLKPGYHYLHDCKTNTSALIEHLKNVQKKVN